MEVKIEIQYVEMPQDHLPQWQEALRLLAQLAMAEVGRDLLVHAEPPVQLAGSARRRGFSD